MSLPPCTALAATGWSDSCRVGFAPTRNASPFHGARRNRLKSYRTARSAFPAVGLDPAGSCRESGTNGLEWRDPRPVALRGLDLRVRLNDPTTTPMTIPLQWLIQSAIAGRTPCRIATAVPAAAPTAMARSMATRASALAIFRRREGSDSHRIAFSRLAAQASRPSETVERGDGRRGMRCWCDPQRPVPAEATPSSLRCPGGRVAPPDVCGSPARKWPRRALSRRLCTLDSVACPRIAHRTGTQPGSGGPKGT